VSWRAWSPARAFLYPPCLCQPYRAHFSALTGLSGPRGPDSGSGTEESVFSWAPQGQVRGGIMGEIIGPSERTRLVKFGEVGSPPLLSPVKPPTLPTAEGEGEVLAAAELGWGTKGARQTIIFIFGVAAACTVASIVLAVFPDALIALETWMKDHRPDSLWYYAGFVVLWILCCLPSTPVELVSATGGGWITQYLVYVRMNHLRVCNASTIRLP
jgi:hypothetical protein